MVIAVVGLACLARRGFYPAWLSDTAAGMLLKRLAPGKVVRPDRSHFGQKLTQTLAHAAGPLEDPTMLQAAFQVLCSPDVLNLCDDALLPGWVDQCLGEKSRRVLAGIKDDADPQSARSRDIAPSLLPSLTQWYTPEWVSEFLVNESIVKRRAELNGGSLAVIDPACGAAHLLMPAFDRMVAGQSHQTPAKVEDIVCTVLREQLFGCDIDARVVDLSALSLYLACRTMVPTGELPLPNLFHFDVAATDSSIGSLWLGLDEIPSDVCVWNFDRQVSLHASPLNRKFDIVLTNPPYLSHRLMPPDVSTFLKRHYQSGHFDLYGAFLQLGMRMLSPSGRLAMICQQSFMSIQRYEKLRTELVETCDLECLVQLGAGVFAARAGEKVNNALIVARRRSGGPGGAGGLPTAPTGAATIAASDTDCRGAWQSARSSKDNESAIRCWRVLEREQKTLAEEHGIASLPEAVVPHSQFAIISGAPFAFWCPRGVAQLFQVHPPMESQETGVHLTNGLFTCNNGKFVKLHSQVPLEQQNEYVPYDKGGGQKWYRTTPYMLHWGKDGAAIREYRAKQGQSQSLPGESHYFRPGITYSYIGTKGFRARLLSPGSIFDIASSAAFSQTLDPLYLLGFLNSSLARFLLGILNPTINFQIGDLRRLPLATPPDAVARAVAQHAATAVELARRIDTFDEDSPRFGGPVLHSFNGDCTSDAAYRRYLDCTKQLNLRETECQREIDELIFDLYQVSQNDRTTIESDPWVARERRPFCKPLSFKQCTDQLR